MIDNDQITTLAREYAEECSKGFAPADMPNCLKNEATDLLVCNAEDMLNWLLRRFCIVEKKQLIEEYKSAKHDSKMAHRERLYTVLSVASARKALLESLFPEIAKEVEDDSQTK